jgi:hypothetical protein
MRWYRWLLLFNRRINSSAELYYSFLGNQYRSTMVLVAQSAFSLDYCSHSGLSDDRVYNGSRTEDYQISEL